MYLRDLAMDSFVLLRAGWQVAQARQLLEHTQATHVIVHRTEPDLYAQLKAGIDLPGEVQEYYYLYTLQEARERLAYVDPSTSLLVAFNLHEYDATQALDAYTDATQAPDRAVVMDQGRLVGYHDADEKPEDFDRKDLEDTSTPESRLLTAEFPEQIPLHESRSLLVSLSAVVESLEDQPGGMPIMVAVGTALTIIVQPRRGFSMVGTDETTIVVAEKEETRRFELVADELGPGELRVLAFCGGQCLGTITLKPLVTEAGQAVTSERGIGNQPLAVKIVQEPDLLLLILEGRNEGRPALTFMLKALDPNLQLNFKRYGPINLQRDPTEYFRDFFEGIENLPLKTAEDRAIAQDKLAGKGATLFRQVIPDALQQILWNLQERIQTVQIQSEEPWIPWELCKLQGEKDGRVIGGPFFCEAFEMTRWLLEVPVKSDLHLQNMALVVPKDSGLPFASQERDYMLSLNAANRSVKRLPATFLTIKEALTKGEYDGWHFTGHGGFQYPDPNRSVMLLENQQELTPQDLSDEARNLGIQTPLVFLNACQIGRGDMSLTDIGGWAAQFLRSGAAAFIGAYWSIYDQAASDFAEAFYSRLLSGMPIGRAAREARLAIKPLNDPTWLAYTVWANPSATVKM